ncbi:cGMP-dependent protein kinase, partial [Durusdinium trenchii]
MGCASSSAKHGVHDPDGAAERGSEGSGEALRNVRELRHVDEEDLDLDLDLDLEDGALEGAGELVLASSSRHSSAVESSSGRSPLASRTSQEVKKQGKSRTAVFARGFNKDRGSAPARNKTPKTDEQAAAITKALSSCYMFSDMSDREREVLVGYMWKEKIKVGTSVVSQGKKNDNFYVIEEGTFEFSANGTVSSTRSGSGSEPFFGEMALLFQNRAASTVKCIASTNEDGSGGSSSKGRVWVIDRPTFRHVVHSQQLENRDEFRNAVESIPMLAEFLTPEQRERVVDAMQVVAVKAEQRVVKKGDHGDVCYFIKEGTVECSNIGEQGLGKIELGPGTYFGERALLTDEPRAADVTTLTDTLLLALDRKAFDEHLGPLRSLMDENMKGRVVEAVPILQQLPKGLRARITSKFELIHFADQEVIVREGDIGDRFFLVRSGNVDVMSADILADMESRGTSKSGSSSGAMSLGSSGSSRPSRHNRGRASGPSDSAAAAAAAAATGSGRGSGSGSGSGSGDVSSYGIRIAQLKEGDWFGEMALLHNEPRTATCVARGPVECFALSYETFKLMRGKSDLLMDTSHRRMEENRQKRQSVPQVDTSQLSLKDIVKRKILGKGTFGTVYLAETTAKAPVKGVWALKMMNKAHIVDCDQTRNVANERNVLKELSHPFVLQLMTTFQDKNSLYMLLEFVQGGELFSLMQEHYRLPLSHAQFYAACIVDAFDYMHSLDIIYRDLKPENILIDAQGFVKIADFGFAKRISGKTFTLCGTPEYLAPEVVLGKGHDKGVDYWGVGILVYEILAGISPFADEYTDDQIVVCKNIVNGKIDYNRLEAAIRETETNPPSSLSDDQLNYVFKPLKAKGKERKGSTHTALGVSRRTSRDTRPVENLVRKLLTKQPHQRFGCLKDGALDIKRHPFFGIDQPAWIELRAKNFRAPFVPVLESETDTSNFDDFEPDAKWDSYSGRGTQKRQGGVPQRRAAAHGEHIPSA